jgi:hypothetical protein
MGRKQHSVLVVPCFLLCVAVLASTSWGASLTVVKSINDIWGNVAMQAAEVGAGRRVLQGPALLHFPQSPPTHVQLLCSQSEMCTKH